MRSCHRFDGLLSRMRDSRPSGNVFCRKVPGIYALGIGHWALGIGHWALTMAIVPKLHSCRPRWCGKICCHTAHAAQHRSQIIIIYAHQRKHGMPHSNSAPQSPRTGLCGAELECELSYHVPCIKIHEGYPPFTDTLPSGGKDMASQSRLQLTVRPAMTMDTMLISLMRMFRLGPEVSLKGSPTVSPTTVALCTSPPLPPK